MSACGICNGTGRIRSVRIVQNHKGESVEVVDEIPCSPCSGKGGK